MAAFKQFMSFCCQCDVTIHQMCHKSVQEKAAATFCEERRPFSLTKRGPRFKEGVEAKVRFI